MRMSIPDGIAACTIVTAAPLILVTPLRRGSSG